MELIFRILPSLIGCAVFLVFMVLFQANDSSLYYAILNLQGIPRAGHPFSDLSSVLMAISCKQSGVNVFFPNHCMGGGEYNYSPFLLRLSFLSQPELSLNYVGIALVIFSFISLMLLPPSRSILEVATRSAAGISSAMIFACERGNLDLFIFCGVISVSWLNVRSIVFRIVSYVIIFVLAALKYYPITLIALMIKERIFYIVVMVILTIIFLIGFLIRCHAAISMPSISIPRVGPLGMDFGALNVPFGLSLFLSPPPSMSVAAVIAYRIPIWADICLMGLILGSVISAFRLQETYRVSLQNLDLGPKSFLVAGAIVIVTCFYIAQNIVYREIFLLLCLPGFFRMHDASVGSVRLRLVRIIVAIVFLLWEELFRVGLAEIAPIIFGAKVGVGIDVLFWLFREFVWWWLIIQLVAFLCIFFGESLMYPRTRMNTRIEQSFG